ncbi:hypothetical protein [Calothrix sp. CCY 0018]|uniref:hypothetical protein n=1 Tax=Calothrix sp. CCY 0018 TaxID=3103864 RepID=UPI0039C75A8C
MAITWEFAKVNIFLYEGLIKDAISCVSELHSYDAELIQHLIYKITEEGKLGDRIREYGETRKSFDKFREDGWELPWEDDANVSFVRNDDNTATINKLVTPTPEPVPAPVPEGEPPISDELPITPTPEPVPVPTPTPIPEEEPKPPVSDELPPIIPEINKPLQNPLTLSGDFDLQFWGKNHADLIDSKEYAGGSLSFSGDSFLVDAPAYENSFKAAYKNTEDNIWRWEVPSDDGIVSLGTLIYRNDELEDDFGGSVSNHGANFKLTLDNPVEGIFMKVVTEHGCWVTLTANFSRVLGIIFNFYRNIVTIIKPKKTTNLGCKNGYS